MPCPLLLPRSDVDRVVPKSQTANRKPVPELVVSTLLNVKLMVASNVSPTPSETGALAGAK